MGNKLGKEMDRTEMIVSKGTFEEARYLSIIQTFKLLEEKLKEHPDLTINANLYVMDVGFLLIRIQYIIDDLIKIRDMTDGKQMPKV